MSDKSGLRGFILVSLSFSHTTKGDTILLSTARCLKIYCMKTEEKQMGCVYLFSFIN